MIIEKTQDKILAQAETIERQDYELTSLREDNVKMMEELNMLKVDFNVRKGDLKISKASLEEGKQKRKTLEDFLGEIEQKYENERVLFNETQQELKMLKNIQKELIV